MQVLSYFFKGEVPHYLVSGADTNSKDQLGATPLHRASGPGHTGVVRLLLAADKTIVDCQVGFDNVDMG